MGSVLLLGVVVVMLVVVTCTASDVSLAVPEGCPPVILPADSYTSGQAAWTPVTINEDNCPVVIHDGNV